MPLSQTQQSEIYQAGYEQSVLDNNNWCRETHGFEVGVEQGIATGRREVVEFANHFAGIKHNPEWKSKLKEWGI